MRNWAARVEKAGAVLVAESLIVNEEPEGAECKDFGATIAK